MAAIGIPEEARQEFWPSGAIRIGSILDETWVRLLRETVDEEIRKAGPGGHFADPGRATFFAKEPGAAERTPWHQDLPSPGRVQLEECRGLADGDPLPSEAFPLVSTKELCR
jgi:hypothetical protein